MDETVEPIEGTFGDDVIAGTENDDVVFGLGGNDVFLDSLGDDQIFGFSNDRGAGSSRNEMSYGGKPEDYIFTLNDDGTISVVHPVTGTDTLTDIYGVWFRGSKQWFRIEELLTQPGTIEGTAGSDQLFGSIGDDLINGNGGRDFFYGSLGDDVIIGDGNRYNEIVYAGDYSDYSFIRNNDGSVTVTGALNGTDTLTGIDGVRFQGSTQWYNINELLDAIGPIEGTTGDDYLYGSTSDDLMIGNGGNDVFRSSFGSDTIIGNIDGNDTVLYRGVASDYTFTRTEDGSYTVTGEFTGTDILTNIESINFRDGGIRRIFDIDILVGLIEGTGGDDLIQGSDGDDVMLGYQGTDVFFGSLGDDRIFGDSYDGGPLQRDQVSYEGTADDYTFTLNDDGSVTVEGELTGTDTLVDIYSIWFRGSKEWYLLEELCASGGNVEGTAGSDRLYGSDSSDTIIGNGGSDAFYASGGNDTLIGSTATSDVYTVNGSPSDFTFVLNDDGSVTATSVLYDVDTLIDIDSVWFRGSSQWFPLVELFE